MVRRVFVEKKPALAYEAKTLCKELRELVGITGLTEVRIIRRYDAQRLSDEAYERAKRTVFSEPQVDRVSESVDLKGYEAFAVEYLPGQFDQRADSAEQCIRIMAPGEEPVIKSANIYALRGQFGPEDIDKAKAYLINPVEAREASFELPDTLIMDYETPRSVETLTGFRDRDRQELEDMRAELGLAMDADDLLFCQSYFRGEDRDPTITEIRVIDTYWSDHCRHTTFLTEIDEVRFEDLQIQKSYERYLEVRQDYF